MHHARSRRRRGTRARASRERDRVHAVARRPVEAERARRGVAVERQRRARERARRRAASARRRARRSREARGVAAEASRRRRASGARGAPAARAGGACSPGSSVSTCSRARASSTSRSSASPRSRGERGVAQVERQVGRDLVVAAAAGVQAPRRRGRSARAAAPRRSCGCLRARGSNGNAPRSISRADPLEPATSSVGVVGRGIRPAAPSIRGVGDRAAQVVAGERAVEVRSRRVKRSTAGSVVLAEAPAPGLRRGRSASMRSTSPRSAAQSGKPPRRGAPRRARPSELGATRGVAPGRPARVGGGRAAGAREVARASAGARPLARRGAGSSPASPAASRVARTVGAARPDRARALRGPALPRAVAGALGARPSSTRGLDWQQIDLRGTLARLGYREARAPRTAPARAATAGGARELRVHRRAFDAPDPAGARARRRSSRLAGTTIDEHPRRRRGARARRASCSSPSRSAPTTGPTASSASWCGVGGACRRHLVDAVLAVEDQRFYDAPAASTSAASSARCSRTCARAASGRAAARSRSSS